ncbi:MAG: ATP-dependent sacrificial sulfur transferase LarE, partial [Desulfobacterales bacterium]|nr:ATP-dependent sacrificial sulfur transferase LarE [Desulfobacterales bacterium]
TVTANTPRRCYHCKIRGFGLIRDTAKQEGITHLLQGVNRDDMGDYRPGIAASKELGFKAPLVEAGFTKQDIRECSRQLGLPTWDLPSQSCLATRIPVNDPITETALDRIERAEDLLHNLGFPQVRVRYHGNLARIETPAEDIARLAEPDIRLQITDGLKPLGFTFISLDLEGYATGKMNTP